MADFKGFNLGSSVAMSLKNDGAYMLDSKLVAGNVAQALTLASTARFSGMPIFIIEDNCWYSENGQQIAHKKFYKEIEIDEDYINNRSSCSK